MDDNGILHICYGTNDLYYSYKDLIYGWQKQIIDNSGCIGKFGYISLTLDEENHPHVSYYDAINNDLKYAYYNNSIWEITTVDSEGDVGTFTSIAVSSNDNVCIAYQDQKNFDLKFAEKINSDWIVSTLDSTRRSGCCNSLAFDSENNPHIIHCRGCEGPMGLLHVWRNSYGIWNDEYIDESTPQYLWPFMVIDEYDEIHVAYTKTIGISPYIPPAFDLKYAYYKGDEWQYETIIDADPYEFMALGISLAFNKENRPFITYIDLMGNKPLYITYKLVNDPPSKPIVNGPDEGKVGLKYNFSSICYDIDGDIVYYLFDWGDGTDSGWLGPYPCNQTITASHIWNRSGDFDIKVKAKDGRLGLSQWSDPLSINLEWRWYNAFLIGLIKDKIEHEDTIEFKAIFLFQLTTNPLDVDFYMFFEKFIVSDQSSGIIRDYFISGRFKVGIIEI